jgi:hypothetical protein
MKNKPLVISTSLAAVTAVALGAVIYSRMPGPETKPADVAVSQPAAPEKQPDVTAEKPPESAPAEPAAKPEQPEVKAEQPAPAPAPAPETAASEQPKPAAPAEAKPTFDTVRVESEGSTLAAGQAMPGAEVTLKRNGEEVGKAVANAEGDWVVVTEAPLPKGTSELSLEQKPAAGPVTVSDQSIAVVVPEKPGERAMVALVEPGMPTQVLQKAETAPDAEAAPAKPEETAAAEPPAATTEPVTQPESPSAGTAVKPSEPATAEPAAPQPATTTADATQPAATEKPAETQTALSDSASTAEQPSPTPEPAPAPAPEVKPGMPVSLDAVDYDSTGDIVFSGTASPGSAVRVYVDNKPVGDSLADTAGRWTFAGTEKVSPGGHALRVDQIDQGGKVLSRVELPFVREDAARVAEIVASEQPSQPEPVKTAEPAVPATAEPEIRTTITETPAPDATTTEQSETAAATADPAIGAKTEEPQAPAATTPEAAKTEVTPPASTEVAKTESATTEVAKTEQPATVEEPAVQPESSATAEKPAVSADEPATTTTKADPATSETAVATGEAASTSVAKPEAQPESADEPDATSEPVHVESQESAAAGTADTALPPQPKNGRIVIQPGNNLWKLSRVIYGKGISYTVLYEANKGQIRNPDLIYPGQIFATPNAVPPETIDPKRREPLTADEGGAAAE